MTFKISKAVIVPFELLIFSVFTFDAFKTSFPITVFILPFEAVLNKAMPTQLFYSVTIPVTLWFITKGKKQKGKTLFIDARKMGYMVDRKHRDFTDEDIQKLADTFKAFQDGTLEEVKGFCAVADIQAIAAQDYILTPGRYVGIEEQEDDGEPFDEKMKRLTSELSEMFKKSHELENEIREKLGAIGYDV